MSTQWANIGEDAGALHALVERITEHAAVSSIDYLWLFPPRKVAIGESIVVVIASFDDDPDRRRVATAHFTVSRNRKGAATVNVRYDEHGSAPVGAVPRIVQGVLRRLGEDSEASPREESIGGEQDRWDALIVELGGAPRPAEVETTDAPADSDTGEDASGADVNVSGSDAGVSGGDAGVSGGDAHVGPDGDADPQAGSRSSGGSAALE